MDPSQKNVAPFGAASAAAALLVAALAGFAPAPACAQAPNSGGAASPGATTDVAGVRFERQWAQGGAKLNLNGAGLRTRYIFKVYAAGLYLASKASTPAEVLSAPGPKRMQIVMLRDIDANDLGKLFTQGIQKNVSREEFSKTIFDIAKMGEIFASKKKLAAGEWFAIEYTPGVGTTIVVNGKPAAEPFKEPEFFTALMKIWFGPQPADAGLRDSLLGLAPSHSQPQSPSRVGDL